MKVKTAAKINLSLDVTGKLENGYHTIESVFQTVGLYDEISVDLTENGIEISCELPEMFETADPIPCDERNIAYKAAKRFFEETGRETGCRIHIKKGIPSQAGMGGGSTDAAAVLYCLNKLTGEPLDKSQLEETGAKIGADVPFFITGGTAYVGGFGEQITAISDYSGKILVIAKGQEGVSTPVAYSKVDSLVNPVHPQTQKLVDAVNSGDENAYKYFGNLFEDAVGLNEVSDIKQKMTENGALSSVMTGSGSAVFGLFSDKQTAEKCCEILRKSDYFSAVCETVGESFIVVE
ncbi:MAG: 4-(cytidine 5'-diphospho)-2-C-methyl-D-erythritol kinase [Ruminococcus sp.]|nr:4-(cytidine 5'-diphospho)-2-C-methyl-D-erythritol kinase [Ruminococcus sp.]